jgi:uncharacterized iron-regulated membrane protein
MTDMPSEAVPINVDNPAAAPLTRAPAVETARSSARDPQVKKAVSVESTYRTLWRWHFYAGLVVGPILFLSAVTGGLLSFRPELEREWNAPRTLVEPQTSRVSYLQQWKAAAATHEGWTATGLEVETAEDRATVVRLRHAPSKKSLKVFVDPHTGEVLGESGTEENAFFRAVETLHRRLFLGMFGRVVVELAASWSLVLLVTGLCLWWPRSLGRLGRAMRPRFREGSRVLWRDLHSIAGVLVWPAAFIILATALWYTPVWGKGFRAIAARFGQRAFVVPPRSAIPKSQSPTKGSEPALDEAVAQLRNLYPAGSFFIGWPKRPDDGFFVTVQGDDGPSTWAVMVLDQSTGTVLTHRKTSELGFMDWWTRWNLPLHTGSFGGLATKALWLAATLVIAAMPVTGAWMWWLRRPTGTWGLPPDRGTSRRHRGLVAGAIATGILLPTAGLSFLIVLATDRLVGRWRRPSAVTADNGG